MSYIYGLITMLVLDAMWISFYMKDYYIKSLASILRYKNGLLSPDMAAAVIVYVLIYMAIALLIDYKKSGFLSVLWRSMLLGLCLYGVYDFTALALFNAWSWGLAIIDVVWGVVLCSATATIIYCTSKR